MRRRAALLLPLLLLTFCARVGEPMVSPPAPAAYGETVAAERAAKDRRFQEAPDTPLLAADLPGFRGLDYWPVDPSWRYAGPIERYPRPEPFTIISTTGKERPCERWGRLAFARDGRTHVLQVYRLLDGGDIPGVAGLFLPFTDATTGKESYPAGRYVDLEEEAPGRYVVDFNRAYNPLCAYGAPERYACPVTPAENRLAVRVEAGERGWHGRRP